MNMNAQGMQNEMTHPIAESQAKLDERFLTNIQGKDFVLYAGLLDLAHQYGLLKLEVEQVQLPTKENGMTAICKAIATASNGAVFSDIGDANPSNVNKKIAPHILRMASTRAKARALRDLTNIGITCLEELGDLEDVIGDGYENSAYKRGQGRRSTPAVNPSSPEASARTNSKASASTSGPRTNASRSAPSPPSENKKSNGGKDRPSQTNNSSDQSTPRMSEAQRRAILNLASRRGIEEEELLRMVEERYGVPLEHLPSTEASSFIRYLQQSA